MTEQSCGTCRHYFEFPGYDTTHCQLAECRAVPTSINDNDLPDVRYGGRFCPIWKAKETSNA